MKKKLFTACLFINSFVAAQTGITDDAGNKYSGNFTKTDFSGTGTCAYANGDKYTGNWKDGAFEGTGTYYWKNGDKYTGSWTNGLANSGVFVYANKEKYDGKWNAGAMEGKGTYYYSSGKIMYKGDWKDNRYDGDGSWFSEDGIEWFKGKFKTGERISGTLKVKTYTGDTLTYTGFFKDGEPSKGKIIYPGGSYYEGPVKNRVPDVNGSFYYVKNGKVKERYVGAWTNGVKDGSGSYVYYTDFEKEKHAKIYSGIWRDNKLVVGESYQAGNVSYSGKFSDVSTLEKALAGNVKAMFDMGSFGLEQGEVKGGIAWLEKCIEQNYGQAVYLLGSVYMQDKFVPKDEKKGQELYAKSIPLLRDAVAKDDTTAILLLGFHQLQNGEKEGIVLLEKAAKMGNADAMIALGAAYQAGNIVTKDAVTAMKLFREAAEKENSFAMYILGWHLYEGDLGTQNVKEGLQWLEKAGSLGYTEAYIYLGEVFKTEQKGFEYFEKGAELGNVECMLSAAGQNYVQKGWISKPYAVRLTERAAKKGNTKALNFLAAAYHQGNQLYGIYCNCETSVGYYAQLASMGDANAYSQIFYIYTATYGKDGKPYCEKVKDYSKALAWLQKGVEAGNTRVMNFLALQYAAGKPELPQNYVKAFELYLKAAELGDIDSLLIDCYKYGFGTKKDKKQAAYWQRKYDEQERKKNNK